MKGKSRRMESREEVLVFAHRELVMKAAAKFLGKHYIDWVEDITQEVMLKVLQNIEKFDESKGKIEAWMYTITRNLCFDLMAKKENLPKLIIDENFVLFCDDVSMLEYKGLRKLIKSSLDQLNELDRTLLVLRYYFEYSGREISKHTGLPENQVAARLIRAKNRLKVIIEKGRGV